MIHSFFLVPAVFLLLTGCTLPRISVLDDPLSSEEHLTLGMAYEKQGEFALAIREYKSASKDLPQAYLFLGNVYFIQKAYVSSEKQYKKAIKELPDNPRPYNNLAWLYYTQAIKLEEAEALARQAIKLAPDGDEASYQHTLELILKTRTNEY